MKEVLAQKIALPVMQLFTTLRAVHETIKKVDRRISSVEQQQLKLATSVKELTTLIKSNERSSFTIKGSTWEVSHLKIQSSISLFLCTQTPLKEQAAKLFCRSLTREPLDADINVSEYLFLLKYRKLLP